MRVCCGLTGHLELAWEAAMHTVIMEQMRVGLGAAQVVDRDRRQVVAAALDHRAQHQPADASESVDGDLHRHGCIPSLSLSPSAEPLANGGNNGLGGDTEVFVKNFIRRGGSEAGHPDENPVVAQPALPAEPAGGLDADTGGRAQHLGTIRFVLLGE